MKEFTATVTLKITASDHAAAVACVTEAVAAFNQKKLTSGTRGPERVEIDEVVKVRLERE